MTEPPIHPSEVRLQEALKNVLARSDERCPSCNKPWHVHDCAYVDRSHTKE